MLRNGKKIGYAEYGDLKGKPLFFFHGWPSSRLQAKITDKSAKKLGIRVISLDRPGYGSSEFAANRTLLNWPDIVEEVADKLRIMKFAVVGVSGGGPYAAVCAYKIPQRLTNAGIIVGLAPTNVEGVLQGMAFFNKLAWRWYHTFPFLMQISSSILLLQAKRLFPEKASFAYRAKADQKLLERASLRSDMIQNRSEAFRQGKKAAAMDLRLYTENWGFQLKDIKSKVLLWYGDADKNVSVKMGQYYATQIPKSKLKIYPNEGHMILATHAEEILIELIS